MYRRTLTALLLSFVSLGAPAQLFRAYLATDGNDANPCTLAQPCRLLPAAHAAVADGGEIWMLDSANYNTAEVNVTKSVSILAVPGVVGSLVATGGGSALAINTAGVTVSVRNLVFVHLGASYAGIYFTQGTAVHVADCEFVNIQNYAIRSNTSGGIVTVKNSRVRGNAFGAVGFYSVLGRMSLSRVDIAGTTWGVWADSNSHVTLSDSVIAGANTAALAFSAAAASPAMLMVERTSISNGNNGIYAQTSGAGAVAQVFATQNTISHTSAAVVSQQFASSTVSIFADGNALAGNEIGFGFAGGGTIFTRGNNTLKYNTTDVSGGSLTAAGAF
jgi:hypothetical protein